VAHGRGRWRGLVRRGDAERGGEGLAGGITDAPASSANADPGSSAASAAPGSSSRAEPEAEAKADTDSDTNADSCSNTAAHKAADAASTASARGAKRCPHGSRANRHREIPRVSAAVRHGLDDAAFAPESGQ
jgi:hypothetical protein